MLNQKYLEEFREKFTYEDIHGVRFLLGDTSDRLEFFLAQTLDKVREEERQKTLDGLDVVNGVMENQAYEMGIAHERERIKVMIDERLKGDGKPHNDTKELHEAIAFQEGHDYALTNLKEKLT